MGVALPGAYAPGFAEIGPSGLVWYLGVACPGANAPVFAETGPSGLVWYLGGRYQVLTHLALLKSAGLVGALGPVLAFGLMFASGVVCCRVVVSCCVPLRFRPEGPISGSPGRSPGSEALENWLRGLKGRFQSVCGYALTQREQLPAHAGLNRPSIQNPKEPPPLSS